MKKKKGKLIKIIEDLKNKIIEKYIREKNVLVAQQTKKEKNRQPFHSTARKKKRNKNDA